MSKIVVDHLHNIGYNNAEIESLIDEKSVFEEDESSKSSLSLSVLALIKE